MRNASFRRRGVLSRAELGSSESALEARAPSLSVFYGVPEEAGPTQGKPQGLLAFPWGHSRVLWNLWGKGLLPLLRLTHPRPHQPVGGMSQRPTAFPSGGDNQGAAIQRLIEPLVLLLSIAQTQNLLACGPYSGKLTGIKCSP